MKALGSILDIVPAIVPVDLQAAQDGDWVSLKNAEGCLVVVFKAAGTAGDDPDITVEQATAVAGTNAKVLNAISEYYTKQGTLTSVGTWTANTQTADELMDLNATSAESQMLVVADIPASALDKDNGFDCLRVRMADTGVNAQLGCAFYVLYGLCDPQAPAGLPSSIID